MLGVPAPVHAHFVDGHVDGVFEVVLGQYLIHLEVVVEEALNFEAAFAFKVSLVLENFTEAVELGFFPELAACGGGYLYTEGSLSVLDERYLSRLFSRSLAVM